MAPLGAGEKAWAWSLLVQERRRGFSPLLKLRRRLEFIPLLEVEWGRAPGPLMILERRRGLSVLLELETNW